MISQTGVYAYFTFADKFTALNGIYQVVQIEAFGYARDNAVDFINTTYVAAGLTSTDWANDYTNYASDDVYFLKTVNTDTPTVYPVPLSMLVGEPDYAVEKYANLILTVELGPWSDPSELTWVINNIDSTVSAATGVTNNAQLYEDDENALWLRKADYNTIATARKDQVKTLVPYPVQVEQLKQQYAAAKAMVAIYEAIFAQAGA